MIDKILGFMKEAGRIALEAQKNIDLNEKYIFKEKNICSVVTSTDLQISRMFKEFIETNFSGLDYIIVDEEFLDVLGDKPYEKIKNAEYAFVIDPIDGTLPFSLKMPEFGISVGILKYGKPYVGAIYVPANKEAAYFDGLKGYWLQNAFNEDQKKIELKIEDPNPRAFLATSNWLVKTNDKYNGRVDIDLDLYSAVVNFLYVATNRARAYYFGVNPWDMAGAWALLKYLGLEFMNMKTGAVLEEVSGEAFGENWNLKDIHVVCRAKDFVHYQEIVELMR